MEITKDILYVGVNDHLVDLFEGQYDVPNGMAYNSYLICDDKVAVMDSVDAHFTDEWITKIAAALGERTPDYLVVQHMEPDHSGSVAAFAQAYPGTTIVASAQAFNMMKAYLAPTTRTAASSSRRGTPCRWAPTRCTLSPRRWYTGPRSS